MLFTDLALARRLERAEAGANVAFVEARAALAPEVGATWCDVAGTWAMFDGVDSPLTQTFGLGLFAPVDAATLDALEAFFGARGAAVHHEVSPLADPAHLAHLADRGYRPVELTTALHRPLVDADAAAAPVPDAPAVRVVSPDALDAWADCAAAGWGETPELAAFMRAFGRVSGRARGTTAFAAMVGDEMVATGALAIHGGVALLAGASTRPAWRGRGAQGALLRARLTHAAAHGCDVALMAAAPGSTSQTNAERQGFRVAYTRTKWARAAA